MDNELVHYGVLGQKWGVITKREGDLRSKAKNVVSSQKDLINKTKSDVKSAEWMSKPLSLKLTHTVLPVVVVAGVSYGMSKAFKQPISKAAMFNTLKNITIQSVALSTTKEIQGRSSLRRYNEKGNRDLTKKQYKSLTPETIIGLGMGTGLAAYQIYNTLGLKSYKSIKSPSSNIDSGKNFVDNFIDPAYANETNAQWKARMAAIDAAAGFG